MHGHFSRVTFDPLKHYSAVLIGQGQVTLDAAMNEQSLIQHHYLRALAADLIGPYGGPRGGQPLRIVALGEEDLGVTPGHYYVDGLLAEAESPGGDGPVPYYEQPGRVLDPDRDEDRLPDRPFVVYLRVWERHITAIEDPSIREIALGDTAPESGTRSKIVWQVLAIRLQELVPDDPLGDNVDKNVARARWTTWETAHAERAVPLLRARARRPDTTDDAACTTDPEAAYRGAENQLYRVEVHSGGPVGQATFKWSRDNGSVAFEIDRLDGGDVGVRSLGHDTRLGLEVGQWVEVVDDATMLGGSHGSLRRITAIDRLERQVTLDAPPDAGVGADQALHPLLRRWDHNRSTAIKDGTDFGTDNAIEIVEGSGGAGGQPRWLNLEDGVQVEFRATGARYTTGDYWDVPARTLSGDVEWPQAAGVPAARPPAGVVYHHAPLALVRSFEAAGIDDLRSEFEPLAKPV